MKITKQQAETIFDNFYDAIDAVLAPIYSMNMDLFAPGQKSEHYEYDLTITNMTNGDHVQFQFNLSSNLCMMTYRKDGVLDGSLIHNPLGMKEVHTLCNKLPI